MSISSTRHPNASMKSECIDIWYRGKRVNYQCRVTDPDDEPNLSNLQEVADPTGQDIRKTMPDPAQMQVTRRRRPIHLADSSSSIVGSYPTIMQALPNVRFDEPDDCRSQLRGKGAGGCGCFFLRGFFRTHGLFCAILSLRRFCRSAAVSCQAPRRAGASGTRAFKARYGNRRKAAFGRLFQSEQDVIPCFRGSGAHSRPVSSASDTGDKVRQMQEP